MTFKENIFAWAFYQRSPRNKQAAQMADDCLHEAIRFACVECHSGADSRSKIVELLQNKIRELTNTTPKAELLYKHLESWSDCELQVE